MPKTTVGYWLQIAANEEAKSSARFRILKGQKAAHTLKQWQIS